MDTPEIKISQHHVNQRFATEVLELGESLFEIAVEARDQQTTEGKEEAYPVDELRAAAQEFFSALHLLLGIEI